MYNIEELRNEKESCRKKIITFSILTGVAALLIVLSCIIYGVSLASILSNDALSSSQIATKTIIAVVLFVVFLCIFVIAALIFIPFIVINGIKHGKRRRLLNKIDNDNGVING